MARTKEFDADPNPVLCILARALDATRNKSKLSDRDLYQKQLTPGTHRYVGTLDYDLGFTVGEETTSARSYGTPTDTILALAFYFSGALREHFIRAAMIVKEIRLAELEERKEYRDVTYTFKRKAENKKGYVVIETTIPAAIIKSEAERIEKKLFGDDEEESTLVQEQVADCMSKLKVDRKYEGPINLESVSLGVHRRAAIAA